MEAHHTPAVRLGLKENWRQFSLLVLVNAFVGGMVGGMWVQAGGIFLTVATRSFGWWMVGSLLLGVGTAMVYPSLIAAVSDESHPS